MTEETEEPEPAPRPPPPIRARRWSRPPTPPQRPRPYRFALRLIGIPAAAVAGVLIYRGLHDRFVLPECDSDNAKRSLTELLSQMKLEPSSFAPITTVSSGKERVVCKALLPLPDGAKVAVDYTFYWQGSKVNMRYSVARKSP